MRTLNSHRLYGGLAVRVEVVGQCLNERLAQAIAGAFGAALRVRYLAGLEGVLGKMLWHLPGVYICHDTLPLPYRPAGLLLFW